MDQALTLKQMTTTMPEKAKGVSRVIAVSSGKGGVGKTNSVVNLAVAFAKQGKKVLLLDADLGLGNVDVLLGLAPRYNIGHVLRGEKSLEEILVDGPAGIKILPASSGIHELTDLDAEQRLVLCSYLEDLDLDMDLMIIDTGAGISSNVLFFNTAAQDIVVVVSPEPTSLTDAYALIKVLNKKHGERSFKVLVNQAKNDREAKEVYRKLSLAAERFLSVSVDYLGFVPFDANVQQAVVRQRAVTDLYPNSRASAGFSAVAREITSLPLNEKPKGGMQFFWRQMLTGNY